MPALPQQRSAPGSSRRRMPSMARRTARGAAWTPCACCRWHGASYTTSTASGPAGRGPAAARSSVTSRTRAAKSAAAAAVEQVTVVLEQRAAAGAVHGDEVRRALERRDIPAGERRGAGVVAGVLVQRAAASLPLHLHDAIPVGLERAPRGVVDVGEEGVHHAAGEEGDGRSVRRSLTEAGQRGSGAGQRGRGAAGPRGRGGQHAEGEGDPSVAGECAGDAGGAEPPGHRQERTPERRRGEDAQDQPARSRAGPSPRRGRVRAAASPWPYATPEGQAGSQPRQPRQRSRWRPRDASVAAMPPVASARISTIRPRGLSFSSPVAR